MYESYIIFWLSIVIIFVLPHPISYQLFIKCNRNARTPNKLIFKLLTICQIAMSSSQNNSDKPILLRAYQCKIKSKINLQEFYEIVNFNGRLSHMNQKGLLLVYLCEMLLKAFVAHGLQIRNFISSFDKKDVKKRQRREGGSHRKRKRKTTKQSKRGEGKTLQQLSNQSLSNPSNVQRPRINVENKQQQSANQVPPSKEKGDDSNGSKESKEDSSKNRLKIELNKITQQIRGQEETYIPDVDFVPATQIQQNSQSSSSQTGQISNLSEKIKIFTSTKQSQRRGTTTRRKTGHNAQASRETRTKKKKYQIIDQSTFIEETRASDNDATLTYNQTSHFDTQEVVDLDLVNNFIGNLTLDGKQMKLQLFEKSKIEQLRNLFQGEFQNPPENNYNIDMIPSDDPHVTYPDYTMSQPISVPSLQPDFFKDSLQIKDTQFTFQNLVNHSTKDKATLFYQLLWREQNDELSLFQSQPQFFSTIRVKQK